MKTAETVYIAGGCFWGGQKFFSSLKGVEETEVGYANGNKANPTYQEVCQGISSAAETVKIVYDPEAITLKKLLEMFLRFVDPFAVNKQGEDEGEQYRSGVYYVNPSDKAVIESFLAGEEKKAQRKFAIEVLPLKNFYKAEEYHQDYLEKNPNGYCHINMNLIREEEKKG